MLSPRHVPDEVYAVPSIPRTHSGKKLEVPVKRILTGSPAASVESEGSLADPGALEPFVEIGAHRPEAWPAPGGGRRSQPAGQASDFVSRYWSNPTIPFCRPMPLSL